MTNHPNRSKKVPSPILHLERFKKQFPDAWKYVEEFRQGRGKDLPDWPNWCFLPLAGWYSIVSKTTGHYNIPIDLMNNVAKLAALETWRITKGIYRFHPETQKELFRTTLKGNIPCEIFTRLPEWCIYIELQSSELFDDKINGFFVHLEHDINNGRMELRFIIDTNEALHPYVMHLGEWSVQEAIERAAVESQIQFLTNTLSPDESIMHEYIEDYTSKKSVDMMQFFLSLLIYLCSQEPEYKGGRKPENPYPKRTKKGWKLFLAQYHRIWNIGHDIGEAIIQSKSTVIQTQGKRVTPHIRRAHWHGFWTGPKDGKRIFDVRWLPPIPVNSDLADEREM